METEYNFYSRYSADGADGLCVEVRRGYGLRYYIYARGVVGHRPGIAPRSRGRRMNRYQLNRDAEEIDRIMSESVYKEPRLYAMAVIIWHILNWIRRHDDNDR